MGITSVIGPLIYGLSFAWTVRHPELDLPGLPFILASITMLACLGMAVWSAYHAQAHAMRDAAK